MRLLPEKKLHRRLSLAGYIAALLIALYTLAGFVILPAVGKSKLPEIMHSVLHRNTTVGDIRFNPYSFVLEVSNFTVACRADRENFVTFDLLRINLDTWKSMFTGAVALNEFTLRDPMVTVVRRKDNTLNFQDLLEGSNATEAPEPVAEEPKKAGFEFSCADINLTGGHFIFVDRKEGVTLVSSELNVVVPSISNIQTEEVQSNADQADISLTALIGNTTRLGVDGDLDVFQQDPHIDLRINLSKLPITQFMAYAPKNLRLSVPSGSLDLKTRFVLNAPVNATNFEASGNATLTGLSVLGPDNREILKIPELAVNDLLYRFPAEVLDLSEIILDRPEVNANLNAQGQINLATLVAQEKSGNTNTGTSTSTGNMAGNMTGNASNPDPAPNPAPAPSPRKTEAAAKGTESAFVLNLGTAEIRNGRLYFEDNSRIDPFNSTISPLNLALSAFSTNTSRPPATVRFRASSDKNATYALNARVRTAPLDISADVQAGGLRLDRYSAYFKHQIRFDVPRGTAGISALINLAEGPEGFNALVHNGTLKVDGLELVGRDTEQEIARIDSLTVGGTTFDLLGRKVGVARVALNGGRLDVVRSANGTLNLQEMVAPSPKIEEAEKKAVEAVQNNTWDVLVSKVAIQDFELDFEDKSPASPFKLEASDIDVEAGPFSQNLGTPLKAEVSMEAAGGKLELGVEAVPDPLSATVDIDVSGLELAPFSTFVSAPTHLSLTGGTADVGGRLSLKQADKDLRINFSGNSRVRKFRAADTRTGKMTLAWNAFDVEGLKFVSDPMEISIKEMALIKPYTDVIRDQNGTINLATMVKGETEKAGEKANEPKKAPAKKSGDSLKFRIDRASISDGEIDFADLSVTPEYEAELASINATAAKFDMNSDEPADISLNAKLNDFAELSVKGQGAMLTGAPSGDAVTTVKNVGLVQFNAYCQKYLGYAIRGGKLTYTGDASIKDRNIKATNIIRLDNIDVGQKVNPNPVMDVPLALGVSLLKNSDGDIELDVPISGNLDDPKFDLSKEIFATTFRLFSQVVLAPFAFFKLDFGSAETGYVPFEPGSIELSDKARANLNKLAKAVISKPNMNLAITGYADPTADLEGVKRYDILHRAKLMKMKKLEEEGRRVRNPDTLKLDPQEYEDYLGEVYSEVIGGLTWGKDVKEMETALMDALPVGPEELIRFGTMRATAVRQYLSVSGMISPDRLFVLRPDTPQAPPEKDAPPIRADVTLSTD